MLRKKCPSYAEANDWEAPEYVRIAERARSKDKSLGQKSVLYSCIKKGSPGGKSPYLRHGNNDR